MSSVREVVKEMDGKSITLTAVEEYKTVIRRDGKDVLDAEGKQTFRTNKLYAITVE